MLLKELLTLTEALNKKNAYHRSVENAVFRKNKHMKDGKEYLHDLDNDSDSDKGQPMLVTFDNLKRAEQTARKFNGKVVKMVMGTYRIVKQDKND